MKAVPWPPRLRLIWVVAESHSHKDLHSLRRADVLQAHSKAGDDAAKIQVCLIRAQVSA